MTRSARFSPSFLYDMKRPKNLELTSVRSNSGKMSSESHLSSVKTAMIFPFKNAVSERFFAENEIKFIEESENPDEAFFEIWTKKEAYSKMLGKGLAAGFNSFDVTGNALGCKFYTKRTNGYAFSLCAEEISALPEIGEMSEGEFLQKLSECLNFTFC